MSESISTSIHIKKKPSRRKSADESTRHLNGNTQQGSQSSTTQLYYLEHKNSSRSLDDLNDSMFTDDDVMIEVNGNLINDGSSTVKSAAVITLNKENFIKTFSNTSSPVKTSTTQLINDSNNNSFPTDENDDDVVIKRREDTASYREQRRRLRNKSTGDVIDMKKKENEKFEDETDVSASVNNIYENGLYTKIIDNGTHDRSPSSNLRPKKPQRSKKSLQHLLNRSVPLDIGNEDISMYYRELNASFDEHNNLSISKEDFDAFVNREKIKYSGNVSQTSFVSEDDSASELSRSRVQSWGSESMNTSNVSHKSMDFIDVRCDTKMKQLGDVLSDQLDSLEDLLSTRPPPRRSSAQNGRRSRSVENVCEKKRLSMIEESNSRQNSRRNVHRLSYDLLERSPTDEKCIEPQIKKALPDIPREPTMKDRLKSIKRSLSMSRKRIVKKSGDNIEFPALRKSIRLPKGASRSRKRSVSMKDVSQNGGRNHKNVLLDDHNIVLRGKSSNSRELFADHRSSRVIGLECDVMNEELKRERKKVGIFSRLKSRCKQSYCINGRL